MKIITAHDPEWRALFAMERRKLSEIFGPAALSIHHIGSTSIPDIWAKPVIDILVEAGDLARIDACTAGMTAIGYEARGEYGIPGRRYFARRAIVGERAGIHIHIYEQGSPHITRHIAFRDYLLARPDAAAKYSALKRSIADPSGVLPPDYVARKEDFVREIERAALSCVAEAAKAQ